MEETNSTQSTGDKLLKAWVYKTVCTVMEERNENALKILFAVNEFLCHDETREFGLYFKQNYAFQEFISGHMHTDHLRGSIQTCLKAIHHVLKHIYFEKKKVKTMNQYIVAPMKLTRDRIISRMMQLSRSEASEAIRGINDRHGKSLTIPKADIAELTIEHRTAWIVKSQCHRGETYTICKTEDGRLVKDHRLICKNYNVCVCVCSCLDSLIHGSICKHICCDNSLSGSMCKRQFWITRITKFIHGIENACLRGCRCYIFNTRQQK